MLFMAFLVGASSTTVLAQDYKETFNAAREAAQAKDLKTALTSLPLQQTAQKPPAIKTSKNKPGKLSLRSNTIWDVEAFKKMTMQEQSNILIMELLSILPML